MNRTKFNAVKYISLLIVMAIYFTISWLLMWFGGVFAEFEVVIRAKAVSVLSLLYCLVFYILLVWLEAIKIGRRRILDLIFGFFFASFCVNVGAAIVYAVFMFSPFIVVAGAVVVLVFVQCVIGLIWIKVCHHFYELYQFRKEAIFIYGKREDEGEYVRVNNTINRYFKISRSVDFAIGQEEIFNIIEEAGREVVVYIGDIPFEIRNRTLKFCMKNKIECYSIPKISDIYIQSAKTMQLNDKLLLRYPPIDIQKSSLAVKRMLDIIVSLVMIIVLSPVMLVITILIKAEDHGPVLYRQDRVTKDGRPFKMLKFRSMWVNAEAEGARLAGKNDDRITRVGKVIRNIHFDELPQLVNVLRGEMSIVGPRPERMEFIEEYSERIPEFSERLKVKGGLTGYAQVYGRYNTEPEDKIKYDLFYIYNYSIWMDIKIIILTVRILFQKENTEGVDDGQRSALKEKPTENI